MRAFHFRITTTPASLSDRYILRALKSFSLKHRGHAFTTIQLDSAPDRPFCSQTAINRLGSWHNALTKAGIRGSRPFRCPEHDLIANLRQAWERLGRPPGTHTLPRLGRYSASPYKARWGSVRQACIQLARFHNGEISLDQLCAGAPRPIGAPPRPASRRAKLSTRFRSRHRNSVPLGLRFRILERDHYRCALCGNSPASDPTIRLHVDHIHPLCRGGSNHPGNLRTLCQPCNLGKSARVTARTSTPTHR